MNALSDALPWSDIWRLVSLRDANTRVVIIGTLLLGLASGLIGVFALLRRRALVGDALSHAALPGICLAFMTLGYKSFGGLLLGALISGIIGVLTILFITQNKRIDQDTAIGVVLTSFFGLGICLSRLIQNHPDGTQAGLENFIYGKAASMLVADAWFIAIVCGVVVLTVLLLFKELALICFDPDYARTTGWPVLALDIVLMASIVAVTMVGLQSVGVVLIISLLITPSAAARFWSNDLRIVLLLSATIGAISAVTGTAISALTPQLPTGPVIVIAAALIFAVSATFAPKRGILSRYLVFKSLQGTIRRQNLLRAIFELLESNSPDEGDSSQAALKRALKESFLPEQLVEGGAGTRSDVARELTSARQDRLVIDVESAHGRSFKLTEQGIARAIEVVRNHRLWELYLINFADIAPSHVDTSADRIEHVLAHDTVEKLEAELRTVYPEWDLSLPSSPHPATIGQIIPQRGGNSDG